MRKGWTTGACATAAAKAAYTALLVGEFPDPVTITLPGGEEPSFALAFESLGDGTAKAGVVKDAGDDPDVTHAATIISEVRLAPSGSGVSFFAGEGVGVVTRRGLPLAVGEPAINPVPRAMIRQAILEAARTFGGEGDVSVTITVPGGQALAQRTWNPRLGILGGISILGTTGIVIPYSCAAWIESIHRGIDVARAAGEPVIAGCTGTVSEQAAQMLLSLPDHAMIDMGDFAGGMLKYLRRHPVPAVYVAGGFAKLTKLAQGCLDLHSSRSQVDLDWLAALALREAPDSDGTERIGNANTAAEALALSDELGIPLGLAVARQARDVARKNLRNPDIRIGVLVFDRAGVPVGHVDPSFDG